MSPGLIGRRCDHPPVTGVAHDHRPAPKVGAAEQLDRHEERVHVHVKHRDVRRGPLGPEVVATGGAGPWGVTCHIGTLPSPVMADSTGADDLWATIRADLAANAGNPKGKVVVTCFRLAHAARGSGPRRWWSVPILVLYRLVVDWILGIEIPPTVTAGPGLAVFHGTGLVVHSRARLGRDVVLRHGVTIGALGEDPDGRPATLGDRVSVGAGALVLGDIVVGDDARIGAGAVVVTDVPARATVVGNPARVVGDL